MIQRDREKKSPKDREDGRKRAKNSEQPAKCQSDPSFIFDWHTTRTILIDFSLNVEAFAE